MADRRERFKELLAKRKKSEAKKKTAELRHIAQGQAPMESMTESPEWEIFRQILQHEVDRLEGGLENVLPTFMHPETTNIEQILTLKCNALVAMARRDALMEVIEMPKEIIADGQAASEQLKTRMAGSEAASKGAVS